MECRWIPASVFLLIVFFGSGEAGLACKGGTPQKYTDTATSKFNVQDPDKNSKTHVKQSLLECKNECTKYIIFTCKSINYEAATKECNVNQVKNGDGGAGSLLSGQANWIYSEAFCPPSGGNELLIPVKSLVCLFLAALFLSKR